MKKIVFQLKNNQLGYLEAEEKDVEILIRQLRQEGHSIRLVNDPDELLDSLDAEEPAHNEPVE